jgi:hypothetical protein
MAKAHKLKFKRNSLTATVPVTLDSTLAVTGATTLTGATAITGAVTLATTQNFTGASGSNLAIKTKTATITGMSGGTASSASFIPAGCVVLGFALRVTTLITAETGVSFSIGDGSDVDKWGTGIAFAANTTVIATGWVAGAPTHYASAANLVLTPNAGTFSAGAVRLVLWYYDVTAPTS